MNRMCLKRSSVSLNRVCFSSILRLSFISKRCRDITSEKNCTSNFSDQSRSQNDSHQSIAGHTTIKLFQFSHGEVSQLFFSAWIWVKRNMYHKIVSLTNKRQASISDWILFFAHGVGPAFSLKILWPFTRRRLFADPTFSCLQVELFLGAVGRFFEGRLKDQNSQNDRKK